MLLPLHFAFQSDPLEYMRSHRVADAALVAGDWKKARTGFERCLELAPQSSISAYGLSCALSREGMRIEALDAFERAVALGYCDVVLAASDEALTGLHFEDRFIAALGAMGVSAMSSAAATRPASPPSARILDERAQGWASDLAVDPKGRRVATAGPGNFVYLLDAHTGLQVGRSPDLGSETWAVRIHPAGGIIAALSTDGVVHLWTPESASEPVSATCLFKSDMRDGPESSQNVWWFDPLLEFDPTGERLLAAAWGCGGTLLDRNGKTLRSFDHPLNGLFHVPPVWSADGATIAMPCGRELRMLDGKTGEPNGWVLTTPTEITGVACDPLGKLIATGHPFGILRVWDVSSRRELWTDRYLEPVVGEHCYVQTIHFSQSGERLGYIGSYPGVDRVFESASGKRLYSHERDGDRMGEPLDFAFSPDGSRLWSAFCSGGMALEQVQFTGSGSRSQIAEGRSPRVSSAGLAVFAHAAGVSSIDTRTGGILWQRPWLGREGELTQTPQGYFAGEVSDLDGLALLPDLLGDRSIPLAQLAIRLFDPKRVRASQAGMTLVPLDF